MSPQLEEVMGDPKEPRISHPFRSWDELGRHVHIDWMVKGLIESESLSLIFGPSGAGKSFLVFDLLAAVARGTRLLGHKVRQGTVLLVAAENGRSSNRRKAAYERHHDLEDHIPFYQEDDAPNLLDYEEVEKFIERAKAIYPTIIAIDTLNRAAPGLDENSSRDMGRVILSADRIRSQTGAAVLLVHHTGKERRAGPRGHSSLNAACDTVIEVAQNKSGNTAKVTKARDGEFGLTTHFRLEQVELATDEDGAPITSCVVVPADAAANARHIRSELPNCPREMLAAIEAAAKETPAPLPNRREGAPFPEGTPCTTIDAAKRCAEQQGPLDRSLKRETYRSRWSKAKGRLQTDQIIEIIDDKIIVIG